MDGIGDHGSFCSMFCIFFSSHLSCKAWQHTQPLVDVKYLASYFGKALDITVSTATLLHGVFRLFSLSAIILRICVYEKAVKLFHWLHRLEFVTQKLMIHLSFAQTEVCFFFTIIKFWIEMVEAEQGRLYFKYSNSFGDATSATAV